MFKTNVGDIVTSAQFNTVERVYYRKTSIKQVAGTVAETDILNGEVTIAAGDMGASGMVRITMNGDWANTTGSGQNSPRFKVKLGAGPTTILDTGVGTNGSLLSSGGGWPWRGVIEIVNTTGTGAQAVSLSHIFSGSNGATVENGVVYTTGEGWNQLKGSLLFSQGFNIAAIDTTAAMAVQFTVINASASASYVVNLYSAIVELL